MKQNSLYMYMFLLGQIIKCLSFMLVVGYVTMQISLVYQTPVQYVWLIVSFILFTCLRDIYSFVMLQGENVSDLFGAVWALFFVVANKD